MTHFMRFGKVVFFKNYKDPDTKAPIGKIKIIYDNPDSAARAQKEMNNKTIIGSEIVVILKEQINKQDISKSNVFIKNLDQSVTQSQLENECSKFGPIRSIMIKKSHVDGVFKSLGFGFVYFEKEQDAKKFVSEFNGKEINGKKIEV